MPQFRRCFVPGGHYFFTVVTRDRRTLLTDAPIINALRDAFRRERQRRPFAIDAAVILPDHLHCIWQLPPDDADFPARWREIKKAVTRVTGQPGQVWQPRYWEHLLVDEADWRRHCDYIHYNPVKHGYVTRPVDWPWSSFHRLVQRGWYTTDWGSDGVPEIAGMHPE